MIMIANHVGYLLISITVTVLVGRTLHQHGRLFLIDIFAGDKRIADSVNNLLLVGFYLTNIALIALAIKFGGSAHTWLACMELLSTKIGWVLLILGLMHFLNLIVLCAIRWPDKAAAVCVSDLTVSNNVHRDNR